MTIPTTPKHRINLTFTVFLMLVTHLLGDVSHAQHVPSSGNLKSLAPSGRGPAPAAAMGIMVGEVDDDSALVQMRLIPTDSGLSNDDAKSAGELPGAPGVVEFVIQSQVDRTSKGARTSKDDPATATKIAAAIEARDYIARVSFSDLKPDTTYEIRTRIAASEAALKDSGAVAGPSATFTTLAGANIATETHFTVVTGMNYAKFHGDDRIDRAQHVIENNTELPASYQGEDKQLGYPALAAILETKPQFFVGTGDNVYYDTPDDPRAETVAQMRAKWHQQFRQQRFIDLFAAVPTMWEVDDHDYRVDDGDNSGLYRPLPEVARAVLLEQLPYAPVDRPAAKTYRTVRVNQDLQIWLTENRFYRDDNALPDTLEKSIWGAEQRDWLLRTIADSDANFKILISPTPMVGPDDLRKSDNHCDVDGFRSERDYFFAQLKQRGLSKGFYIVCGDRHWQYHAVDSSGMQEFSCGALVDANSRLPRLPGDPAGTDPDGLIKHLHTQTEPSGGFLNVYVRPASKAAVAELEMRFHDEKGVVLYRTVMTK